MKTISKLLVVTMLLSLIPGVKAQEEPVQTQDEVYEPVYITVTRTHWNGDPEADFSDWLETEKEYFQKVTMKNDLILDSGVYTHYFTADNSEVILYNVYESWEDIEKAEDINQKLIEEAWPDESQRQAYFEK